MDVDDAAGQGEGEGHPSQGEAVTEAAPGRALRQDLLGVNGVDQRPGKNRHACGETNQVSCSTSKKTAFPNNPRGKEAAGKPVLTTAAFWELWFAPYRILSLGNLVYLAGRSLFIHKMENTIHTSIHPSSHPSLQGIFFSAFLRAKHENSELKREGL